MTDALERIKNRQRKEVPPRDPGMTAIPVEVVDSELSRKIDIENNSNPDIQISTLPDTEKTIPTLEVKQTTLRLEKAIADELQAFCQREQICREVAIEAMWLEVINDPELRDRVFKEARARQQTRTTIANHKRALTMVQRLT